jgi:hypothetical protein
MDRILKIGQKMQLKTAGENWLYPDWTPVHVVEVDEERGIVKLEAKRYAGYRVWTGLNNPNLIPA